MSESTATMETAILAVAESNTITFEEQLAGVIINYRNTFTELADSVGIPEEQRKLLTATNAVRQATYEYLADKVDAEFAIECLKKVLSNIPAEIHNVQVSEINNTQGWIRSTSQTASAVLFSQGVDKKSKMNKFYHALAAAWLQKNNSQPVKIGDYYITGNYKEVPENTAKQFAQPLIFRNDSEDMFGVAV